MASRDSAALSALTVNLGVMYEQWEPGASPGAGPMANPLRNAVDWQAISWTRYGPRTGMIALLDLFATYDVRSTVHTSGILAESHPEIVRSIVERGHELGAHGWAQNLIPAERTRAEEETDVRRTFDALELAGGVRPVGWISPRCTPSSSTAELVAAQGGTWFGDVFDADLPYELETPAGILCAIPFTTDANDLPMTIRYGRPIEGLFDDVRAAVESRRELGGPGLLDLTVHAHVGARPRGLATLRRCLEYLLETPAVRILTKKDVADDFLAGAR